MTSNLPPALALWAGAALLPLLPSRLRPATFLAFPLAALGLVWSLPDGPALTVAYLDQVLVLCQADPLRRVFGTIFAVIGVLGGLYAFHVRDLGQQVAALTYAGGALAVTFSGDYLTLFVGWEVMACASACLVWAGRTPEADAAGRRYVLTHLFGGSLLLAGIALQVATSGSLLLTPFAPGESAAAWLILAGVALNTALPPLHAWLPDSYPKATVTGAVFLSAYTTKTSVLVLALLFPGWEVLIALGVIMALYGVVYAVLANDIREILAYHIISQVGYMVAAVGIGTPLALNGAAAHAFSHILYKGLLFMGAGVVLHTTGRSRLTELGGFAGRQRLAVGLYLVGAASISGFPLFNGFISKSAILAAAGETGHTAALVLLLLASIGTFLHTGLKLPYFTWFGPDRGIRPAAAPRNMLWAMGGVAALCILFGVAPGLLYGLLPHPMAYRPYTAYHLAETTQLLVLTFAAFWLMRGKLAGEAKQALDVDWFYRRPARAIERWLPGGVERLFAACEGAVLAAARALAGLAQDPARLTGHWDGRRPAESARRLPVGVSLALALLVLFGVTLWGLLGLGIQAS